ncbi:response regulator transcription factor [Microbispora sp. RL4-1S]|uniref:Response regulator transcription factor n=1 Tax=Microbispora oryzae TaxID=2806554 RepID=A0A940WME1_9ACTN|nr:response regulator transcription factor [Microbispora oryzae]MBP2708305.1 response regulator transcription factor [Microbispora oryzae]
MIRILVAEHLPLVRRGLVASLDGESDLEVVADVCSGEDIVPAALDLRPDAAVVDADLPGVDGLNAAARLGEKVPLCRVMVLSGQPSPGHLKRAFAAGVLGYMSIEVAPEQLADGIRQMLAGRRVVDSELAVAALETADNPLTRRELDVLRLAASGARSCDIAAELRLSVGTVRNHLSRVLYKTGARSRVDAVRIAADAGWI